MRKEEKLAGRDLTPVFGMGMGTGGCFQVSLKQIAERVRIHFDIAKNRAH